MTSILVLAINLYCMRELSLQGCIQFVIHRKLLNNCRYIYSTIYMLSAEIYGMTECIQFVRH